jgi:hypothetical protein
MIGKALVGLSATLMTFGAFVSTLILMGAQGGSGIA